MSDLDSRPRVGFAGMTHLGLISATATAERGFRVVGFDATPGVAAKLSAGELPVVEPELPELFAKNRERLTFTAKAGDLEACDVVYIAADVPTDDRGISDLSGIRALCKTVGESLKRDALMVVLCQVPPGFTRGLTLPPERLYYQVETLIFGRAVERAMHPERFIVGCAQPARPIPPAFAQVLGAFGCPILPMRYESAELAKIAINCFLVAQVSTTNTLAELCERIGADWSEIAPSLRLDKRIGPHAYLGPGLGIAGGNLERDLVTVVDLARNTGAKADVIRSYQDNSQHRRNWALGVLHAEVLSKPDPAPLGILGLAYKENTHSTKNSPSIALISHLTPYDVAVYDPVVPASAAPHPKARGASSALDAAKGARAVVLMTPWPEFKQLDPAALARAMSGRIVIDPYRLLDGRACAAAGLEHFVLGVPPQRAGEV